MLSMSNPRELEERALNLGGNSLQESFRLAYKEEADLENAIGVDVDVLENATASLVCLTSTCDDNAALLGKCGGVRVLVGLTTAAITVEHELIHANAAHALVNATRLDNSENATLVL